MRTLSSLAALLVAATSQAGVYVETTTRDLANAEETPNVQKMWFEGGKFRTEDEDGSGVQILKDGSIYLLDTEDKTYRKLDKATMDRAAQQVGGMRKKMEEQLANLPAEQRASIERMLGQKAGSEGKPVRSVRATTRTETAAGHKCTVWEILVNEAKTQELCVVAPDALPGGQEVMATLRTLGGMFQGFADSFGDFGRDTIANAWRDLQAVNGIPVITRDFDEGKPSSEARMSVVREETVPASAFEVPAGFVQQKIEIGGVG